jgi:hypothetical protein
MFTLLGVVESKASDAGVAETVMLYVVTGVGDFGVAGVPDPFGSVGELDWQPVAPTRATRATRAIPCNGRAQLFSNLILVLLRTFTW